MNRQSAPPPGTINWFIFNNFRDFAISCPVVCKWRVARFGVYPLWQTHDTGPIQSRLMVSVIRIVNIWHATISTGTQNSIAKSMNESVSQLQRPRADVQKSAMNRHWYKTTRLSCHSNSQRAILGAPIIPPIDFPPWKGPRQMKVKRIPRFAAAFLTALLCVACAHQTHA